MDRLVVKVDIDDGKVIDAHISVEDCVGDAVIMSKDIGLCQMLTLQVGVDVPASITAILKDNDMVPPHCIMEYRSILGSIGVRVAMFPEETDA